MNFIKKTLQVAIGLSVANRKATLLHSEAMRNRFTVLPM